MQRMLLTIHVAVIATFGPALICCAPPNYARLYDDTTGISYDHSLAASQMNLQLATVPRLEYLRGNQSPAEVEIDQAQERAMEIDRKDKHPPELPENVNVFPVSLGPWIKYSQTYYNPFLYGGPNGPPTFVPSLGVWPSYNQGDGY